MKRNILLFLLFIALGACCTGFFYLLFEKREEQIDSGPQREARANPFLAAERFISAMGHHVESHSRFTTDMGLPPTDGILGLLTDRSTLSAQRHGRILDWVTQGGTLITVVRHNYDEGDDEDVKLPTDPLLDIFGLELNTSGKENVLDFDMLDGHILEVSLTSRIRINDPEERAFEFFQDDFGRLVLLLEHGKGWVILLNETGFVTNENIGEVQNAAFFYQLLLLGNETPSIVWLVFRETYPPLSELLGRYAWMGLASLGLLILLGIWAFAPRLGPIRPDPSPIRRRLVEHLDAGGQFLWNHEGAETLTHSAREALMTQIRHRHPNWLHLSEKEQRGHLGEMTGLPAHAVALALEPGDVNNEERFTMIIGYIETLRRAL